MKSVLITGIIGFVGSIWQTTPLEMGSVEIYGLKILYLSKMGNFVKKDMY